jgi:hypothetical protein
VLCSGYDRNLALTPELDDVPRLQKPFRLPAFLALLSPGAPGPPGCGMLTG